MEIVTSLDLDSFLLGFSRFTNLRGAVDTVYSDNGSTFKAAADKLPALLGSTELHNSLRKKCKIGFSFPLMPAARKGAGKLWLNCLKRP